jgi:hypothetical protein
MQRLCFAELVSKWGNKDRSNIFGRLIACESLDQAEPMRAAAGRAVQLAVLKHGVDDENAVCNLNFESVLCVDAAIAAREHQQAVVGAVEHVMVAEDDGRPCRSCSGRGRWCHGDVPDRPRRAAAGGRRTGECKKQDASLAEAVGGMVVIRAGSATMDSKRGAEATAITRRDRPD